MAQLDRKLSDELTEEVGVAVLAQLVEDKPVADLKEETMYDIYNVNFNKSDISKFGLE